MAQSIVLVCDCGCGRKIDVIALENSGWFQIEKLGGRPTEPDDAPKLMGKLIFSSLSCLWSWAGRACEAVPGLQETARETRPRGDILAHKVIGLYV